tara:strand:+ start:549 stop:758 length:210 start_codon:yes stop_codon:yes gene_type:complete
MPYTDKLTVKQIKTLISKYNLKNTMKGYSTAKRSELLEMIKKQGYKPNDDPKNPQLIPLTSMRRKTIIK